MARDPSPLLTACKRNTTGPLGNDLAGAELPLDLCGKQSMTYKLICELEEGESLYLLPPGSLLLISKYPVWTPLLQDTFSDRLQMGWLPLHVH